MRITVQTFLNMATSSAALSGARCVCIPPAVIRLEDVHLAQAMNYLEAYGMKVGLLINFGARSLEFKRVHKNLKNRLNLDLHDFGINLIILLFFIMLIM